ncbi:hypothetical protein MKW94_016573 [Papaver nudicaule]|uniref:Uncharacterized protein n=1 Tax=Papaver nudicaule TaxID=74823 RepID=A0AA41S6N1_PAPNU|nr:hypothetical protein [Papaver nudicaule]
MEFIPKKFASVGLLLFAVLLGFLLLLQIPSAAAISCTPGETPAESTSTSLHTIYCHSCQDQCITQCKSQGREVTKVECNFWGSAPAVCKCCCALPSSTPIAQPGNWAQCASGETNMFAVLPKAALDCNLCVTGCKTKCDAQGATVSRETCFQSFQPPSTPVDQSLICPCCCKANPPPSPPPPTPSPPPPPSPSPPPPVCPPPPSPSCGSCSVDINIQISSVTRQAPCKYELSQSSSSTAEL